MVTKVRNSSAADSAVLSCVGSAYHVHMLDTREARPQAAGGFVASSMEPYYITFASSDEINFHHLILIIKYIICAIMPMAV